MELGQKLNLMSTQNLWGTESSGVREVLYNNDLQQNLVEARERQPYNEDDLL